MFNPGDIVEIVGTPDDEVSEEIAGSIAEIVKRDDGFLLDESYEIKFINLINDSYKRSLQYWRPKNLRSVKEIKETIIDETDLMSLLEDDDR